MLLSAWACTKSGDGGGEATTSSSARRETPTTASKNSVLRLGVPGIRFELDPVEVLPTQQEDMIVLDLVYDSLTRIDAETGELEPGLAESWESSDDLRTWTFTLGEDATFSDGEPVTATDVKFSLERLALPGGRSLRGVRLEVLEGYRDFVSGESDEISGIEVVDERTVRFRTRTAYAPLPELLAGPIFAVTPGPPSEDTPVSSGPMRVTSIGAESLRLEARSEDVGVQAVEIRLYPDLDASADALLSGDVDWAMFPAERLVEMVERFGDQHVVPHLAELWVGLNLASDDLEDARVRAAILAGVDRRELVREHLAGTLPLDGVIPRGVPGYRENACGAACAYDPDRARDLVESLGQVPTLQVDYDATERSSNIAEAVATYLEKVGFDVELREHEPDEYRRFVAGGEAELFVFGWAGAPGSADTYLAPLFLSTSAENVLGFGNEDFDDGIARARATADPARRAELYARLDAAVTGFAQPLVPLAQTQTLSAASERVSGLRIGLDGTFDIRQVTVD